MKLYINTRDRQFFDADGNTLAEGQPQIPYKSRMEVALQLCTETPSADTPGVNPATEWTKDTSFDLPGVSALLSVDSDFKRRNKGSLKTALSAGTITSVTGTFSGVTAASFRIPGTLRFFDTAGNAETVTYTDLDVSGSTVTFTIAEGSTLEKSYETGDVIDAPDSLYMQSALNAEKSSPATGLFVFDLVADSVKLRNAVEYSNTNILSSIAGMEMLIFTAETDGTLLERNSYVCRSVSVTGTIGDPDSTVTVPDNTVNALITAVSAILGQGVVTEYSADSTNWHSSQSSDDRYARFRIAGSSGTSDSWVVFQLIQGTPGTDGTDGKDGADGTPAGFGQPVINLTTGEPGTQASGTVTATGDNTAKVFTFDLTIPQGATGNAAGFGAITATAETVPSGTQASAAVTPGGTNEAKTLAFTFQIPQGAKGDPMTIDATGLSTELSTYDAQLKGFSYLATDTGKVYIKASDSVGDWSDPVVFQGPEGTPAGFGQPVINLTTGEPGTQASGTVTASGPNTAKIFTFDIAVPQGEKGEQGIPGTLENLSIEVNAVTDGAIILDNPNAFPVAVYTAAGNCYPIEKESLTKTETGWRLIIAKYLAYDNTAVFTGPWYVYCAGGVRGEDGWSFSPEARGLFTERSTYDSEAKGFSFLAFDEGNMYFKLSRTAGDWTEAIPFRGERGEQGLPGSKGADGKDGADGRPGPMAEISISDNGTWVVNGTDTGESVRSRGANIIMSPTRPAAPYEGMIYIYDGENEAYFDLDKLPVVKGTTPPATAEEGTIFLVED